MWNCCCLRTCSVSTIQPGTSLQCHFLRSHTCRMHMSLAVTCHLHVWQNDWNFVQTAAVSWGEIDTEIRVATESWLRRRKFSCSSLAPQSFDHESGALQLGYPRSLVLVPVSFLYIPHKASLSKHCGVFGVSVSLCFGTFPLLYYKKKLLGVQQPYTSWHKPYHLHTYTQSHWHTSSANRDRRAEEANLFP